MHQEIEIEYKNILTKNEYDKLLTGLQLTEMNPNQQINYYFETDEFHLKSAGAALRIREKNNECVYTLKEPHETGLLETHESIPAEALQDCINGNLQIPDSITERLSSLNIPVEKLSYKGSLTTYRIETKWNECLVVLDHSVYHNTEDYELELEAPSVEIGEKAFQYLLTKYEIVQKSTPNKIERFFQALESNR
ncbi:CYTH domain-containing protein [Salinibacillus xinjiangensis]|uniref:CYTH domain-containing protein n=1 Tax=Salinibacillus xinjiangensis TaxID=1229268 RepID=A0A6G1X888_9BACI|nr:CYTH domain-containing protein [Salinibacillus xinjiangensis]MRG87090.1 CYTH domain-containing protein [Salinibacillus xinjiangensis]